MTNLPPSIEQELTRLGVIEKKAPGHAPVARPKKNPETGFRKPIMDDKGEPDF